MLKRELNLNQLVLTCSQETARHSVAVRSCILMFSLIRKSVSSLWCLYYPFCFSCSYDAYASSRLLSFLSASTVCCRTSVLSLASAWIWTLRWRNVGDSLTLKLFIFMQDLLLQAGHFWLCLSNFGNAGTCWLLSWAVSSNEKNRKTKRGLKMWKLCRLSHHHHHQAQSDGPYRGSRSKWTFRNLPLQNWHLNEGNPRGPSFKGERYSKS